MPAECMPPPPPSAIPGSSPLQLGTPISSKISPPVSPATPSTSMAVPLHFPRHGGELLVDGKLIKFTNTCPIDNWIVLLRAVLIQNALLYEEMLIVARALQPALAEVLEDIKIRTFCL